MENVLLTLPSRTNLTDNISRFALFDIVFRN